MRKLARFSLLLLVISPGVPSVTREIIGGLVVPVDCNATAAHSQSSPENAECTGQKVEACIDDSSEGFEKDSLCIDDLDARACNSAQKKPKSQSNCTTASVETGL